MSRKRIKRHNGKPIKDAAPVLPPSLERLAAVLEQIASMDALPPPLRDRAKEAPVRDLNDDVRRVFA